MTFSGRQLRGKQVTNFQKSNTNSWRFFDPKQIKGVLKFPPSEINNALIQEAEKQFHKNIIAKKEERTKKKCKATTIRINEEISGKEEDFLRNTKEIEASEIIKSDITFSILTDATQTSEYADDLDITDDLEPPLRTNLSSISTTDTVIKSTNLASTNLASTNLANTNSFSSDSNSTIPSKNIPNSNHSSTCISILIPQHINISYLSTEQTISNTNETNEIYNKITKEDDLRLIEYPDMPILNSVDITKNIIINKTVTAVAKSIWTSIVNVVRTNTDIMKLFSLHMKKDSLYVTNYNNNNKDHPDDNNNKNDKHRNDNVYNNNDDNNNNNNKDYHDDNNNMNPESDGGTFITNLDDLNILKSNSIDHSDNSKDDHNNNVDLNNSDNIPLVNITQNNPAKSLTRKPHQISPHPPTLSKPSIRTIRQRNLNPTHNPHTEPDEGKKLVIFPNNLKKDFESMKVLLPVKIDHNEGRKNIPLVNITQNNPVKSYTPKHISQKKFKNLIPSTENTHTSPTPPLGIKKRPNRNDLHTKATTKQQKITPKDKNDEINRKQFNFEDYQNLNIARKFKMHLISNGHRIPHFLQNVVISETVPSLKKNRKISNGSNKDENHDGIDDNDTINISKFAGNNDENNDSNNDDNNGDDNGILNLKEALFIENENDDNSDDNNDRNDDDNNIKDLRKGSLCNDNENNDSNNDGYNDGNNDRDDGDDNIDIMISKIAAAFDNNDINDDNCNSRNDDDDNNIGNFKKGVPFNDNENNDNNDRNDGDDNDIKYSSCT
jgi:hypothetical protein